MRDMKLGLRMQNILAKGSSLVRCATVALTAASLGLLTLPATSAETRISSQDYESCAGALRGASIADADAAAACAGALYPRDVSNCVVRVKDGSTLAAADILTACRRVRRPIELAACFNDIDADSTATEAEVLNSCRRSLLPDRFSDCVTGLRRNIELSTAEALQTCIAAGDRPQNVLPSFVPAIPVQQSP